MITATSLAIFFIPLFYVVIYSTFGRRKLGQMHPAASADVNPKKGL
jgi:hypothetical protein